ncbi:Lrp/AsnC family transcriptional regulator [Gemmobacter denitrificans]|uniref:Lrp/AsnC family transcriptional regulator n=1 Tax=Gemmobacter denitrificans TaxID=3123040 RepID=A0ABU8BT41_9RHOB
MDDFDRRILRVIQTEPDLTIRDIADRIGLSHSPCWKRIQALQARGILRGKRWQLDREALGLDVRAWCIVKLKTHSQQGLEQFERAARALPEVMTLAILAGNDDYLLEIVAPNLRSFESLIKDSILRLPGVDQVSSRIALRELKSDAPFPL